MGSEIDTPKLLTDREQMCDDKPGNIRRHTERVVIRDDVLSVRLSQEERWLIEQRAQVDGLTASAFVRHAVLRHLRTEQHDRPDLELLDIALRLVAAWGDGTRDNDNLAADVWDIVDRARAAISRGEL